MSSCAFSAPIHSNDVALVMLEKVKKQCSSDVEVFSSKADWET